MDVKTVFKALIGTVVIICVTSILAEMFNLQVNGMLLRAKMDNCAELSLDFYAQESYKELNDSTGSTTGGMLGTYDILDCNGNTYLSGQFYPIASSYEDIYEAMFPQDDLFDLAHLRLNGASKTFRGRDGSTYIAKVGYYSSHTLGEYYDVPVSFQSEPATLLLVDVITARQFQDFAIPDFSSNLNLVDRRESISNEILEGYLAGTSYYLAGVAYNHQYSSSIDDLMNYLSTNVTDSYFISHNTAYQLHGQSITVGSIGTAGRYIEDNLVTPLNIGIPYFDITSLNAIFRWQLVSSLSQSTGEDGDRNESIQLDEDGNMCLKWNGFCLYADQARITRLIYNIYDTRSDADRLALERKTGTVVIDGSDPLETRQGIDFNLLNSPYVYVIDFEYEIPMDYAGMTPLKSIFNWANQQGGGGYQGFLADTSGAGAGTFGPAGNTLGTGTTTMITGKQNSGVGDTSFDYQGVLSYEVIY